MHLHIAFKVRVSNYPLPPIPRIKKRCPQTRDPRRLWSALPDRAKAVLEGVSSDLKVGVIDILSDRKTKTVYAARKESMRRLREMEWLGKVPTYSQISRWMNRNHSTVMEACGARQSHRRP